MTRAEKQQQLKDAINKVLQNPIPEMERIRTSQGFYFEELRKTFKKLEEFDPQNFSNSQNYISEFSKEYNVQINDSAFEVVAYSGIKEKFKTSGLTFQDYYHSLDINKFPSDYIALTLIGKCIAYFDSGGYKNDDKWNPERHCTAKAFIRQDDWVNNLLNYLIDNKRTARVSQGITSALFYIKNPNGWLNILSPNHRKKLVQFFGIDDMDKLDNFLISYFKNELRFKPPVNNENFNCWIVQILYAKEVRKIWETNEVFDEDTDKQKNSSKPSSTFDSSFDDTFMSGANASTANNEPPFPPPNDNDNAQQDDEGDYSIPIDLELNTNNSRILQPVLNVKGIAEILANTIDSFEENEEGQMVGIFGKWGRGKTYLVNQVFKHLKNKNREKKYLKINFQAWKFQDEPGIWAYLYETFSEKFITNPSSEKINNPNTNILDNTFFKLKRIALLNLNKNGFTPIIFFIVSLIISISFGEHSTLFHESNTLYLLPLISLFKILLIYNPKNEDAQHIINKYTNHKSHKSHLGLQGEIEKDLATMLKVWIPDEFVGREKIVLFVDDIDRCNEKKVLDIIDSVRIILDNKIIRQRLIVIVAVDDKILKHSLKAKYDTVSFENNNEYAEYLDKLFLLSFKLGKLTYIERQVIFTEVTKNKIKK